MSAPNENGEWELSGVDPSIPEIRQRVVDEMRNLTDWGFSTIKHDFSAFDILGRWGSDMAGFHNHMWGLVTNRSWSFNDTSRTSAEIIVDFYTAVREGAGDAIVMGCNTIGHLGAGLFEVYRLADDNAGKIWSQTRKMGLNSLAFRMHQHNAFHA